MGGIFRIYLSQMNTLFLLILLLVLPQGEGAGDSGQASSEEPKRPSLDFKVFNQMDRPITGTWRLEVPETGTRVIELTEVTPGNSSALLGVEKGSGTKILRLDRKKEGIGYSGLMHEVFRDCGFDPLPIDEFVSLGNAIVLRFTTEPRELPCPPFDGGQAGRLEVVSAGGGPVPLYDLSGISDDTIRSTYSIGGDRPVAQGATGINVLVDPGTEVRFLKRVKSPLDGTFWFEVEVPIPGQGGPAPRGHVKKDSLKFIGSLSLERVS